MALTRDEVDAALLARLEIPAAPDWREGNRSGERRASIPVTVDGVASPFYIVITVRLDEPDYLIALLIAGDRCISRLCVGTLHFDREAGEMVNHPHFHGWDANRPHVQTLPKALRFCEPIAPEIEGKDAAFSWFLDRIGIESPPWLPVAWPHGNYLL